MNPEQDATGDKGAHFDPETGREKRVQSDLHASRNGQMSASNAMSQDETSSSTLGFERGPAAEAGPRT